MLFETLESRCMLAAIPPSIGGDANLSGYVNLDDFQLFLYGFQNGGSTWEEGDFNDSGTVNIDDFQILLFQLQNQKPGSHNTGPLVPESELVTWTESTTITEPNKVIEGVIINGTFRPQANGVKLRNAVINASSYYGIQATYGATGLTFEHVEIRGAKSAAIYGDNFTARRLDIHHTGSDGIKPRGNVTVLDSWIHHLGMNSGSHADGVQILRGSHFLFRGNNFDMPKGLEGHSSNATFMVQSNNGPIDDLVIDRNWLNGGNYTVQIIGVNYGPPTNVTFTNNRFGRNFKYDTVRIHGDPVYFGNVFDDTGEEIPL